MLSGDQRVEGATDVLGGNGDVEARAVVAEEDEPELTTDGLLVALHRRPGLVPVDADGLRREDLLHLTRVATREAEGGEEAESDRLTVADALVSGGSLERVRERVAEVQHRAVAAVV